MEAEAKSVMEVPLPAWLVGDLHGNLHDLIRVLTTVGDLTTNTIVFLGDYVDRGTYSLDVLVLLLTIKCTHPDHIFLIRGNHEFASVNEEYGFKAEVSERFPDTDLWDRCNKFFSYLPLAVDLGKIAVCLHGGLGEHIRSLSTIAHLTPPIEESGSEGIIAEIVWSDPTDDDEHFLTSPRGRGSLFGRMAVFEFLKATGHEKLIRAHECVHDGYSPWHQCTTIFSSSNYCNRGNTASFAFMDGEGKIQNTLLQPIENPIARADATYSEAKPMSALPPVPRNGDAMIRRMVKPTPLLAKVNEVKGQRRASLKGIAMGSLLSPPAAGKSDEQLAKESGAATI
jgi:protein phosphatase